MTTCPPDLWSNGYNPALAARKWAGQFNVACETLRIVAHPYTGKLRAKSRQLNLALAAGVLTELVLAERLTCVNGRGPSGELVTAGAMDVAPASGSRPPMMMETRIVGLVGAEPGRSAHHWIQAVAGLGVYETVGSELVNLGVMVQVHHRSPADRFLHRPAAVRFVARLATRSRYAGSRLPMLMSNADPLGPADIVLAALLEALGFRPRLERQAEKSMPVELYVPGLPSQVRTLLSCACDVVKEA